MTRSKRSPELKLAFAIVICALVISGISQATMVSEQSVEESRQESARVLSETKFDLPSGRGVVHVVTKQTDRHAGLGYAVEIRVGCGAQAGESWPKLSVVDTQSVCDVKPKSPKLVASGTRISITVRQPDVEAFNRRTRDASPEELMKLEPVCKSGGEELVFDVAKYCK